MSFVMNINSHYFLLGSFLLGMALNSHYLLNVNRNRHFFLLGSHASTDVLCFTTFMFKVFSCWH